MAALRPDGQPRTQCPAALGLAGPPLDGPSVVCRVMQEEKAASDTITDSVGGEHITATKKPFVLFGFCCGPGIPRTRSDETDARGHYTFCPIWEAHWAALQEAKGEPGRIYEVPERPKILGDDPEVEAKILGKDPEEIQRKYALLAAERPDIAKQLLGSEILTGEEAVVEAGKKDSEWAED